jgi:prepilin-type processing-associated H-X9-DG protein
MLVVVAIVVILAAILFPVYEVADKRAEATHCLSGIRNLAGAVGLYEQDYDGFLVPARTSVGCPGVFGTSWNVTLLPYHNNQELYLCVSDQNPTYASGTTAYVCSYGINLDLTMVGGYNGASLTENELTDPTQALLFFDMLGSARTLGSSYEANGLTLLDIRHNTGCNFSFADGHARWYRPGDTAANNGAMWKP